MIRPAFKVVLDTNVLFPQLLRDVLLRAAEKELYRPHWSARILNSLERILVEQRGLDAAAANRLRAAIEEAFPEALVEGFEHLELVMPNHPGDRHVAGAATLIGAQVIVTSNIKHFSGLHEGLEAQTPDVFLTHLLELDPDAIIAILNDVSGAYRKPPQSIAELVERLRGVAPSFAADLLTRI